MIQIILIIIFVILLLILIFTVLYKKTNYVPEIQANPPNPYNWTDSNINLLKNDLNNAIFGILFSNFIYNNKYFKIQEGNIDCIVANIIKVYTFKDYEPLTKSLNYTLKFDDNGVLILLYIAKIATNNCFLLNWKDIDNQTLKDDCNSFNIIYNDMNCIKNIFSQNYSYLEFVILGFFRNNSVLQLQEIKDFNNLVSKINCS